VYVFYVDVCPVYFFSVVFGLQQNSSKMRFSISAILMAALATFSDAASIPMPRSIAPSFSANAVLNDGFVKVSSDDYKGKWLVLFFYPFDFTFVCPTEIRAFSDASETFGSLGASVVGVSTDSVHTHLAWTRTPRADGGVGSLKIPLVSDVGKTISSDYGVLISDPADGMFGAAQRGHP
jgi:alkyl hydroperoxide reductase subunit AhpC